MDTSVWSLALGRNAVIDDVYVQELRELIAELRVQMIGPVRQELLSGIHSPKQFNALVDHLRAFPDLDLVSADFECAAECFNVYRKKGVQGSNTDFLICAIAQRHHLPILTTDKDFLLYQQHLPIWQHRPRS